MFIIELTYKVPASEIDAGMAPHMAFLEKYYHSGHFLASGRKEPRDGGIIFAIAPNRKEIEKIIAEDPFKKNDMAEYRVIEFKATKKVKAFDELTGGE
jgi:uncharacterized protein YciI